MNANQQEYICLCTLPRVQDKIREEMGGPIPGDWLLSKEGKPVLVITCSNNTGLIRLPQVHDWQNPERGLWKWLNWKEWNVTGIGKNGEIRLVNYKNGATVVYATPELALLHALCRQWGIEEEKG